MTTPPPDPFDRALAAYSAREQARFIPTPNGLADRVTAAVVARPRWLWAKWLTGSVLVLGLTAAGVIGYAVLATPDAVPAPAPPPVVARPETSAPRIGDTLSEAGDVLAKLSRSAAEKATPPRALFSPVETVKLPTARPMESDVQPAADTLASVPAAARSGLEPMTNSTRRAINLFLRDTGLRPN